MTHDEFLFLIIVGTYAAITFTVLAFRGWSEAIECRQALWHFIWPVIGVLALACVPMGFGMLIGRAFKEGWKVLNPFRRQALKGDQ